MPALVFIHEIQLVILDENQPDMLVYCDRCGDVLKVLDYEEIDIIPSLKYTHKHWCDPYFNSLALYTMRRTFAMVLCVFPKEIVHFAVKTQFMQHLLEILKRVLGAYCAHNDVCGNKLISHKHVQWRLLYMCIRARSVTQGCDRGCWS